MQVSTSVFSEKSAAVAQVVDRAQTVSGTEATNLLGAKVFSEPTLAHTDSNSASACLDRSTSKNRCPRMPMRRAASMF